MSIHKSLKDRRFCANQGGIKERAHPPQRRSARKRLLQKKRLVREVVEAHHLSISVPELRRQKFSEVLEIRRDTGPAKIAARIRGLQPAQAAERRSTYGVR